MRIGRVIAGILVVVLVAFGLIYLDQHGYFRRSSVERNGVVRNDTPPVPADVPADTNTPNPPPPAPAVQTSLEPDAQFAETKKAAEEAYSKEKDAESRGELPIGTARADFDSTMRKAETDRDAAKKLMVNTTPATLPSPATPMANGTNIASTSMKPAPLPRGAVMDVNGNPCMPIRPRMVSTVVHHRRPRRIAPPAPMAPPMTYVTYSAPNRCSLLQTTSSGMHVVDLPSGMLLNVSVDRDLSTSGSAQGQTFSGYLVGPITYCGRVIVPAGSQVQGSVALSQRRGVFSADGESALELRINSLEANGYNFNISASSTTREARGDVPYRSVTYDTDGNDYTSYRRRGRDVDYPASSVVSFWLRGSTPVYF